MVVEVEGELVQISIFCSALFADKFFHLFSLLLLLLLGKGARVPLILLARCSKFSLVADVVFREERNNFFIALLALFSPVQQGIGHEFLRGPHPTKYLRLRDGMSRSQNLLLSVQ